MELFTAYVLFSLYSQPDAPIFSLFQHFLTSALECILSHTTPADLPSLCSVVAEVHTLIQSVLAVMTAEDAYATFTACLPQVEPSWREAQRPAIAKALQEWLGGVLDALRTMVDGVIAPLRTVEQLAGVKRRVREVLTAMQAQWAGGAVRRDVRREVAGADLRVLRGDVRADARQCGAAERRESGVFERGGRQARGVSHYAAVC